MFSCVAPFYQHIRINVPETQFSPFIGFVQNRYDTLRRGVWYIKVIRNSSCIFPYYKWSHFVGPMKVRLGDIPTVRQYRIFENAQNELLLLLILIRIRFRASDFGQVAKNKYHSC